MVTTPPPHSHTHAAASVKAIAEHGDDQLTKDYLAAVNDMTKVVLAAKSEAELTDLVERLTAASVRHSVWVRP
jgi:hypothetical protein